MMKINWKDVWKLYNIAVEDRGLSWEDSTDILALVIKPYIGNAITKSRWRQLNALFLVWFDIKDRDYVEQMTWWTKTVNKLIKDEVI